MFSNYNNLCEEKNYFCKCYYIDVLLYHCSKYCNKGLNGNTWKTFNDICVKKGFIFDVYRSKKSGNIIDYGIDDDEGDGNSDFHIMKREKNMGHNWEIKFFKIVVFSIGLTFMFDLL